MPRNSLANPFCSILLSISLIFACETVDAREIAGWVERAVLLPSGIELRAKLDTGAKHSSIGALRMESFYRDGTEYIRFQVKNKQGETVELEEPVLRNVTIKRHFGKTQQRPVVMLTVCLGNVSRVVEVNLVNRAGFNYPLLLGRSFMQRDFFIDPGATFRLGKGCKAETDK
jgi:hypothetical protein